MLFNPYLLLGLLVAFIATAGGSYFKGMADEKARCTVRIDKLQNDAITLRQLEAERANQIAAELEKKNALSREANRILNNRLNTVVARPVYAARCLDDDGLRLANTALTGQALAPAGPAPVVPATQPPR